MTDIVGTPWVPTDYDQRQAAISYAVQSGAKNVVATATEILAFLTAGNASAPTEKPATETAKPVKADAPKADKPAKEQSSDKPADTEQTTSAKSPSDAAGFAADGSEITKQDLITAATKFVTADGKSEADLVKVFAEFNAAKLSEVEPSDYAAVIEKLALPASGAFD